MPKWQEFATAPLQGFKLGLLLKADAANAGLLLGTSAGKDEDGRRLVVIAADIDARDPDVVDTLIRCLPASKMAKVGAVGRTVFLRASPDIKSASFDGEGGRILDLLCAGRQTVVPGSISPVTLAPYRWIGEPVAPDSLPIFTAGDLEVLLETLETVGWKREGRALVKDRAPFVAADHDPDDLWSETKAAALSNLSDWVPALDLYGCRPARGGYEAVAHWRASSSGRNMTDRSRNLSIQASGIKDFGTNDTYSAIDLVMSAQDVDQSTATSWLRERLGLDDVSNDVFVDVAALIASHEERDLPEPLRVRTAPPQLTTPAVESAREKTEGAVVPGCLGAVTAAADDATHGVPTEMPAHLLDCPGLVGEIMAWMGRTAQKPVPLLNLAASLCIVATAAGRKFAGPTEAGLVCYFLALSGTGTGKAHPIRAGVHLMNAAGIGRMVAPSSWMSGSALIQHLERQPACLSFADEVAEFLAKLSSAKASTHERAVSGNMRELWGINWGTFTPPGWANSRDRATPKAIHAPAYSFLGLSVPDAVWAALQGSDVTNGFLNRFICFSTKLDSVEQDPEESVFDVPEWLVERLRDLAACGGSLASATMHHDGASAPLVKVPWDGGPGSPAHQVFKDLRDFCRTQAESETLMKRTAEIAVRLATIRAIGIAGPDAKVTVADMEWARDVALWSAGRMIADAAAYMSETEWQAKAKFVLRCITDTPGRRITRAALCKRVAHRFPARDLDAIIKGLIEAEEVADNSSRSGRRGPEALTYVAL